MPTARIMYNTDKKIRKEECVGILQLDYLTLDEVKHEIDIFIRDYKDTYSKLFTKLLNCYSDYEDDMYPTVYVYGLREETDEEFKRRIDNS